MRSQLATGENGNTVQTIGPTMATDREWLETDGLGGYAMGTAALLRTRRYHALLCAARRPPADRVTLLADVDVTLRTSGGTFPLAVHRFVADGRPVVVPAAGLLVAAFAARPWPRWTFALPDGTTVEHERFVPHGHSAIVLRWRVVAGSGPAQLQVRPLLAARDHHALQVENAVARLGAEVQGEHVVCRPYAALPALVVQTNGRFHASACWYRRFEYAEELARGYDHVEDLSSPGEFEFDLAQPAVLLAAAAGLGAPLPVGDAADVANRLAASETARRAAFASPLRAAADQFLVRRDGGLSIAAGYPWFADWGRDTFLALRGLCLATGRLAEAAAVVRTWLPHLRGGMLPNRFPDGDGAAEYNSVDAALWFAVATDELLQRAGAAARLTAADRREFARAIVRVVEGCQGGCRHGIGVDPDGLLRAGAPGVQLTWMDAVVGGRVVTPRAGKPVEVEALWIAALDAAGRVEPRWQAAAAQARASFAVRFWNPERGCLYDVVDVDHEPGEVDDALRPNQILAVGGLPTSLLPDAQARAVVDTVERTLWTPLGLRTLAPGEPGYEPRYAGDAVARDLAYHQGTVWPWLAGPFVEAWVRVRGGTPAARAEARARFVLPLFAHLGSAGLGHVSEVADAEPPHRPGGAPFQAWSVGELLRLQCDVLARPRTVAKRDTAPDIEAT